LSRQRLKLTVTVYAVPVAQPRQQQTIVAGHAHNYTPADNPVNSYKASLRQEIIKAGLTRVMDGPIYLAATFYLPRPKRLMRKKDPDGPMPHARRPDRDNLEKATMDALSRFVWRDDAQVCDGPIRKFYAEKKGLPRVELVIQELSKTA
jgi:Holliday junction resolvase RusA-like endonuclease